jgi:hypothetical protein
MATIFGHVSLQLLDALGVTVSAPFYTNIDDTKTIAQLMTQAGNLASAVDPVTDSQITQISVQIIGTIPGGLKTSPAATAENERTGLLNFSQTGSPYKYGVDIPAIADSKIVNGKIDLTDGDITFLITLLTSAGTVFSYVSTAIKTLVRLIDALLSFRKHRKAESRRSFEVNP